MVDVSLMEDFIEETREHLEEMESAMLRLEENTGDKDLVNTIFRQLHTIKGSADYLGMRRIGELSHALESLLETVRQGKIPVHRKLIDTLLKSRDRIGQMLLELAEVGIEYSDIEDLLVAVQEMASSQKPAEIPPQAPMDGAQNGTMSDVDPELLEIFLEQIQNDFLEAKRIASEILYRQGALECLQALEETLESMRSSANYMGYETLIGVYDWLSEHIREAKSKAAHGSFSGGDFVDKALSPFLDTLSRSVPNAHLDSQIGPPAHKGDAMPLSFEQGGLSFEGEFSDDTMQFEDLTQWSLTDETQSAGEDTDKHGGDAFSSLDLEPEFALLDRDAEDEKTDEDKNLSGRVIIDAELITEFIEEASEHLKEMEDGLLFIQDPGRGGESSQNVFRAVHTIKGAAEYLGLAPIAVLCHKLEDLLEVIRQGRCEVDGRLASLLLESKDCLDRQVRMLSTESEPPADTGQDLIPRIEEVMRALDAARVEDEIEDAPVKTQQINFLSQIGGMLEDDQDPELFEIFMDQLEDQVEEMKGWIFFPTGQNNPASLAEQCRESLRHLRYSANYMNYGKLCDFFDAWIDEVNPIMEAGENSLEDALQLDLETIMAPRIEVLEGLMQQYGRAGGKREAVEGPIGAYPDKIDAIDEAVESVNGQVGHQQSWDQGEIDVLEQFAAQATESPLEKDLGAWEALPAPAFSAAMTPFVEKSPVDSSLLYKRLQNALHMNEGVLPEGMRDTSKPSIDGAWPDPVALGQSLELSPRVSSQPGTEKTAADSSKKQVKHTIRVDASKIDVLMNQVGELVVNRSSFGQINALMREFHRTLKGIDGIGKQELKQMRDLAAKFMDTTAAFSRVVSDLQDGVMKVRMLPVSQLFSRYPRLLHDLTRNLDKKVVLEVKGEETELDKMLIEEIADPLVHILRNAVGHGIETVADRRLAGKPESGVIRLNAFHEGNHVVIEVSDDGRGIDVEKVKLKAREMGVLSPGQLDAISNRDAIDLITTPGFSTADSVTHTSGRGVGMDVVKRNIEKLNGTLDVDSLKGVGTRFRIKIPLTLAIFHALLVKVAAETFTIPLSSVDHTLRIFNRDLDVIEGAEVFYLDNTPVPLIRLNRELNIEADHGQEERLFVVVVSDGAKRAGLVVDELMGQEEVVIKPLEDYLQEKSGFSGATILGDGRISLILDVYELIRLSIHRKALMKADSE